MRTLPLAVIFAASTASASPSATSRFDTGWAMFSFGLGGSPTLSGSIDERLVPQVCGTSSCPISSRFAIGGGLGRWGFELHGASSPVEDTAAMDYRDRSRHALRVGPLVRYTLVRGYGVDVSVRGGIQFGALLGDSSSTSMPDPACPASREGDCDPIVTTYEPESYSLVAMPLGATLRLGGRLPDRGYLAAFADLDVTLVRIGFPGDARSGVLRTITYGLVFGTMFDLR